MSTRTVATLATLLMTVDVAAATEYCTHSYARICDGCTATIYWKVTNAKVERVSLAGGGRKSKWCTLSWRSLGGHNKIKLVTPPRNGRFVIESYSVSYTSEKTGTDRVVTHDEWLSPRGDVMRATVIHEIEVVDHTL